MKNIGDFNAFDVAACWGQFYHLYFRHNRLEINFQTEKINRSAGFEMRTSCTAASALDFTIAVPPMKLYEKIY